MSNHLNIKSNMISSYQKIWNLKEQDHNTEHMFYVMSILVESQIIAIISLLLIKTKYSLTNKRGNL